jgi:hypothetical protein
VKTFLTRTLPLLVSIALGTVLSWVSIYAFWFGIWTFHSVPAARAADALGAFILIPAKWVFDMLGGDQSTIFYDPISFSGTNGLVVGILIYCVYRAALKQHESRRPIERKLSQSQRLAAKVV